MPLCLDHSVQQVGRNDRENTAVLTAESTLQQFYTDNQWKTYKKLFLYSCGSVLGPALVIRDRRNTSANICNVSCVQLKSSKRDFSKRL